MSEPTGHHEKEVLETATLVAVERTMKKYADNLLRVLEGISGRLTHLESTTLHLEHMVSDFKSGADENNGATDGKLRGLANMLAEVNLQGTCLS
jgi:L-tryptophan--pyruvate aminotransferase